MNQQTLIVTGGGAAGFFCAVNAARMHPDLKVIIIEKTSKLLSKVRVSGGGRCNVTHHCFEIPELLKKYPRGQNFLKKALHHFYTKDTVAWFTERNVPLKTEADGRMFPEANSSEAIIECLIREANKYGVSIILNQEIVSIEKQETRFILTAADQKKYAADYLCIASGGYPKSAQFNWLVQTGHTIAPPLPSLFTFNIPDHALRQLMGVSVTDITIKVTGTKLQESGPLLITHWGISGPAVLKLSAWGARDLGNLGYHFKVSINWLGNVKENDLRQEWPDLRQRFATQKMHQKNPFELPARLWVHLLKESFIEDTTRWAELSSKQQNLLIRNLTGQELEVKGKTAFKEEFVTCGGINTGEVDANTMQSKIVPGLFFAGEVLDIDGVTGGFNFQNAWTTGWIAAKAISTIS
jgi:predicted Rossmann fold flavoprotein